jgi:hypothetical protein
MNLIMEKSDNLINEFNFLVEVKNLVKSWYTNPDVKRGNMIITSNINELNISRIVHVMDTVEHSTSYTDLIYLNIKTEDGLINYRFTMQYNYYIVVKRWLFFKRGVAIKNPNLTTSIIGKFYDKSIDKIYHYNSMSFIDNMRNIQFLESLISFILYYNEKVQEKKEM